MRFVIWLVAAVALAVWSVFALAGRALVSWLFNLLAIHADSLTPQDFVAAFYNFAIWMGDAGAGVVTAVWIVGALVIVAAAAGLSKLTGGARRAPGDRSALPGGR